MQQWQPDISLPSISSLCVCDSSTYMNRIASRGSLFIERRKRARVRFVHVLYCIVLSEYTFRTRVSPHPQQSPTTPRNYPVFDPRRPPRHFRCEIVERTRIKLYRISESPSDLAILELSVIDGPWRAYRLLTCSQNYSDSTILRITVRMKLVENR